MIFNAQFYGNEFSKSQLPSTEFWTALAMADGDAKIKAISGGIDAKNRINFFILFEIDGVYILFSSRPFTR